VFTSSFIVTEFKECVEPDSRQSMHFIDFDHISPCPSIL